MKAGLICSTLACAGVALGVVPPFTSSVVAQSKSAEDYYKEGDNQYNLGNFAAAVEAFKKGFELETDSAKKPAYLYNIAQAYRLAEDCKNALFFYKRFLALRSQDARPLKPAIKAEVEKRIAELEECTKRQNGSATKDPIKPDKDPIKPDKDPVKPDKDPSKPDKDPVKPPADDAPDDKKLFDGTDDSPDEATPAPSIDYSTLRGVFARVGGGMAMPKLGETKINASWMALVQAGYTLPLGNKLFAEGGATFTFAPFAYTAVRTEGDPNNPTDVSSKQTGQLMGLMAHGAFGMWVLPKLSVSAEIGLGTQFVRNIVEGNPFTIDAQRATGALTVFGARGAVSASYAVHRNISIWVAPFAFTYSPAPSGFLSSVSAVNRMEFAAGVGYHM